MTKLSLPAIKNFARSKKGIGIIVLVLLLIVGGVLYANRHHDNQVAISQTEATSKTQNAKAIAGATGTSSSTGGTSGSASKSTTPNKTTTTPGASPAPGSTPPPLPPAAYADNFSGSWYINFGTMVLSQSGTTVTGTYNNGPAGSSGTISGTVSSQTLTGTWKIGATTGPLSLVKGTHTLSGSYNSTYKWCGALTGYQFPAGCGFAGHWVSKIVSNPSCAMDLTRINNSVSGTYCNGTITSATVSYPANDTKLSGTWTVNPSTTGPFAFFFGSLASFPQQVSFQGNYNTTNYWCGGTTAANVPSTCTAKT